MSAETTTETSLEHWVMELPEDEAACEFVDGPCILPAVWREVFRPCGCAASLCGPHKVSVARAHMGPGWCLECNRAVPHVDYLPI